MTNNNEERVFEELLEFLKRSRGFDFTGYKRSSLMRRIRKQMHSRGINSFEAYLDYLQVHPEEFLPLFNTILINVTGFFRDASAWRYLQTQTLPRLINDKSPRSPIRVWSAGCASGEEAYTLAMILAEILGVEQFRQRIKIYATDVDEEALNQARHASYSDKDVETIPTELQERYFEVTGNSYVFRTDLRRAVIFGRHDLVQDASISRLDLLVCRNTLMYFNAETQTKILARFHFALNDTGVLFLGKAEMMLTHTNLFRPINLQHRIFSPVPQTNRRDRLLLPPRSGDEEASETLQRYNRMRELAFDAVPIAQIIVDIDGKLVLANAPARSMLSINLLDLGRPLQDLEISYRPLELRSPIEQAYRDRQSIVINDVVRNLPHDRTQYLDIQINCLEDNDGELMGVSITFTDTVGESNQLKLQVTYS